MENPPLPNSFDLSQRLARLLDWLARQTSRPGTLRQNIPGLRLSVHKGKTATTPSANPNRADWVPGQAEWSEIHPDVCAGQFANEGIDRFFFWLPPCPEAQQIEQDLLAAGYKPYTGTKYHVLARQAAPVLIPVNPLHVRRLDEDHDSGVAGIYGDSDTRNVFKNTLGLDGFEHFAAFDGMRAVATAMLIVREGIGYLCNAGTSEPYRRRGAHSMLIAARVRRAAELGCEWVVSETLAMLQTSLNNLKHQGFDHAFEKSIFEWHA